MPYNLDFEEGYLAWELSKKSISNGFNISISDSGAFSGEKYIVLKHSTGKNIIPATFYQQVDANFYKNKKVKFEAMVRVGTGWNSPVLFISAKNKNNIIISSTASEEKSISSDWTNIFVEFEIPNDADVITFGVSHKYGNIVHVDNCKFNLLNSEDVSYYAPASKLLELEKKYLIAFANTYGYAKYFCANSELNNINWSDVLLTNTALAKSIKFEEDISSTLQDFYKKIIPQIIISSNSTEKVILPDDNYKYLLLKLHTGVPTGRGNSTTNSSKIININSSLKEKDGVVVQYLNNLREYKEKQITISVKSKIRQFHPAATASLDIRFEDEMGDFVGYHKSNSITSDKWGEYKITCKIPNDATRAAMILSVNGYAAAYFDDVKATIKNGKKTINLKVNNFDFEEYLSFNQDNWLVPNESIYGGYDVNYSETEKFSGRMSLVIFADSSSAPVLPDKDAVVHKKLLENIYIHFPIVIGGDLIKNNSADSSKYDLVTYPKAQQFISTTQKNKNFNLNWQDRDSRLSMVIEVWNLIKHFSLTEIDKSVLDRELQVALSNAAESETAEDFRDILQKLLDMTHDVRARAWFSGDSSQAYTFPFLLEFLDDKLFITAVSPSSEINQNNNSNNNNNNNFLASEIIEINNIPVSDYFSEDLFSKHEWQKLKKLALFRLGYKNSQEKIKIKTKDGHVKEISVERNAKPNEIQTHRLNSVELIDPNTLYINLTEVDDKYLSRVRDSLSKYNKFIFDLRGESSVSEAFLTLLTPELVGSSYTCVPFFSKPDRELISYYKRGGFFAPTDKKIKGKFVFLIDWRTAGASELFSSVVASKKIGKLIGSRTQGSLVSAVAIRLDDAFSISMGSTYGYAPSGASTYNNPIAPDIQVVKKVDDIIKYTNYINNTINNNKDEVIEAAIKELVN